MNLDFVSLELWNFLSFGNTGTKVSFDTGRMTVVLGENLDVSGDDARNGVGKSTILDALFYALYGKTLRGISGSKIVHKFARKNQSTTVILKFRKGDHEYEIERGENPSRLFFLGKPLANQEDIRTREGRAFKYDLTKNKKDTTKDIEKVTGLDILMSEFLWGNSSESIPFLRLPEASKRDVIEALFGFKLLTERADKLKTERLEISRELGDKKSELTANEAANRRIHEQISGLVKKSDEWDQYENSLRTMNENRLHAVLARKIHVDELVDEYNDLIKSYTVDFADNDFVKLCRQTRPFDFTDSVSLMGATELLSEIENRVAEYQFERGKHERSLQQQRRMIQQSKDQHVRSLQDYERTKTRLRDGLNDLERDVARRMVELETLSSRFEEFLNQTEIGKCPTCHQEWHEHSEKKKEQEIARLEKQITDIEDYLAQSATRRETYLQDQRNLQQPELIVEQIDTKHIEKIVADLAEKIRFEEKAQTVAQPVVTAIDTLGKIEKKISSAREENIKVDREAEVIKAELAQRKTLSNPYPEQIVSLRKSALIDLAESRAEVVELETLVENYTFLIELLTKKDSFLRKRIVDKWLLRVNHKLHLYGQKMELPHAVRFDSEMNLTIDIRGKAMDYGNLSRGERSRLNLAVNFSFQDCFESMNFRINVLFIDELLDNGLDSRGATNALEIIQPRARKYKHVFLITHRLDISDQIHDTMVVRKENDVSELVWS